VQLPRELVDSCRRGEPGAFDDMVRATHRSVYGLVLRIVGNPDDASEVTQDVYLRAWRGLRNFRGDSELSTWLYRIAANTAFSHVRRRARAGVPTDPENMPDVPAADETEHQADADLMDRALARLPAQHRAAVVLRDVYGWSCEEIGRVMGATEGAVKVRLFRARQRLADELAASGVVVPINRRRKKTS